MKKFIVLAVITLVLFNPTLLLADTVEVVEETSYDFMQLWDYGWRIAVSFGGAMTIILSNRARHFLKSLTFDQFQDILMGVIEKLSKSPHKLQALVAAFLATDTGKQAFEMGKQHLLTRINEIDERLLDYQLKTSSGLFDDQFEDIQKMIAKLQAEKVALLEKYAQAAH